MIKRPTYSLLLSLLLVSLLTPCWANPITNNQEVFIVKQNHLLDQLPHILELEQVDKKHPLRQTITKALKTNNNAPQQGQQDDSTEPVTIKKTLLSINNTNVTVFDIDNSTSKCLTGFVITPSIFKNLNIWQLGWPVGETKQEKYSYLYIAVQILHQSSQRKQLQYEFVLEDSYRLQTVIFTIQASEAKKPKITTTLRTYINNISEEYLDDDANLEAISDGDINVNNKKKSNSFLILLGIAVIFFVLYRYCLWLYHRFRANKKTENKPTANL